MAERGRRGAPAAAVARRGSAVLGLAGVGLGCLGLLGALGYRAGGAARFAWLFTAESPAQGAVLYMVGCAAFGFAAAALIARRALGPGLRRAVLVAALVVAALAVNLAPAILIMWAIPVWLVYRWATADAA